MGRPIKPGLEKQKVKIGRRCIICGHDKVGQINTAILSGVSFSNICERYGLKSKSNIHEHAENHLNANIGVILKEKEIKNAIDFATELYDLYHKAKQMLDSIIDWLRDPDNPEKFDIAPRTSEILITYLDYNEVSDTGKPAKKKAILQDLINRVDSHLNHETLAVQSMATDNRKLMLDALKVMTERLEQIAKYGGLYQKDRENEQDMITNAAKAYRAFLEDYPSIAPEARDAWLERLATTAGVPRNKILDRLQVQEILGNM